MKLNLTLILLLAAVAAFGQQIPVSGGIVVDLQNATHRGAYLQSASDPHTLTKIIWYPDYNLYRDCGDFKSLKPVPGGYYLVDEDCQCQENISLTLGATATASFNNIQFDFDSSLIKASAYAPLDALASDLKSTGATVELAGYASSEGTAAHNLRLSRDRANAVKTYLVNSGISAQKLKVKAYGETHPVADNSTEAGRVLNRRVEIHKK